MSPLENCYLLIGIVDREDFFESVPKLHFQSAIISPVVNNTEKFVKIKTYLINLKQGNNVCCYLWCLMGKVKQKTNARQEKKILKTKQNNLFPALALLTVQPLSLLTTAFCKWNPMGNSLQCCKPKKK